MTHQKDRSICKSHYSLKNENCGYGKCNFTGAISSAVSGSSAPIFEDEEEADDKVTGNVDVDMSTDLSTWKVTTHNATIQQGGEHDIDAGAIASDPGLVPENVGVSGKVPEDINKVAHVSETKCLSVSGTDGPEK